MGQSHDCHVTKVDRQVHSITLQDTGCLKGVRGKGKGGGGKNN